MAHSVSIIFHFNNILFSIKRRRIKQKIKKWIKKKIKKGVKKWIKKEIKRGIKKWIEKKIAERIEKRIKKKIKKNNKNEGELPEGNYKR